MEHELIESPALAASEMSGFYIVGVGASAGGLEALERMFKAMPDDTGMAFVIVQHLSPDFKSLMDELLARYTRMPIHRVEDGMRVVPNSLYLIPAKQEMIISGGRLLLTEKDSKQSLSLPIDHFFRSLAQDASGRSIAVVLSGTGSDGSRGIRDINRAGGLVIAQSIDSAKFDGMPKSALDTNLVDVVVEPEEIPSILMRYAKHPFRSQLQNDSEPLVDESSIERVFRLLQRRHRIDFNFYKPATIGRRIERRIQLNHQGGDIDEYVERLENDPAELDQLYKDLLIGVTRFFRDRDAFNVLGKDVLPSLIKASDKNDEFRVWVAACATGEEAYSIAILIDECLRNLQLEMAVKIFATDVHQASIDFAHAGVYPEASLEDIASERRDRYFTRSDNGYVVSPEIRKMIVFAPHNLVSDAPFTRLNLITCRNLLIYLRSMAQQKVLSLFHFGLKASGVMMLGSSESPGELADEFEPLDDHWRLFRKRRDVRLPTAIRGTFGFEMAASRMPPVTTSVKSQVSDNETVAVYDELLEKFMPPGILVNEQRQVIQVFGGAGKFLSLRDGRLTGSLLDMVDGDLRLALTGALQRCAKNGQAVCYDRIRVQSSEGEKWLQLSVMPLRKRGNAPKFMLNFAELDLPAETEPLETKHLELDAVSYSQLDELEKELRHTKENLQATIEEMETSNEELQATNEELVASNEELQSTNEELHSVNEELFTVNAEYQKKISELTELTNDVNNLLVSTEVHTLFLDTNLCIRKFTPKMAEVFNLVPHDLGRRIDAFAHNITCEDLSAKVFRVLRTGNRCEENVQDNLGHYFLLRMLPYRAGEGTSGVVLTLIEISSIVAIQEKLRLERERFERAIAANRDGTWDWPDLKVDEMWWSPTCYEILGYQPNEFPARHSEWLRLIHPEDRIRVDRTTLPTQPSCYVNEHREFEYRMLHKSGEYRWYCHRAIVDCDEDGNGIRMTGSVADIHDRKCVEMESSEAIRRRDNFLSMLSHELRNPMGAVLNAVQCSRATMLRQSSSDDRGGPVTDSQRTMLSRSKSQLPVAVSSEVIQIIERQTKHMARLLDDLLDVARFGQGKIEFRKKTIDLTAMVDDVLEAVIYEVNTKKQILHPPRYKEPIYVFADPARIKQVQVNLLINASKYTAEQGEIWYDLDRQDDLAIITVRDRGEGIPSELLNRIFDLFVQSETSLARSSGGLGVGLSLARSITEAHDGTIDAESEGIGKGSTFRIRLPLTEEAIESLPEPQPNSFHGIKLLLVEDNYDARMMLAETLRLEGFDVAEASDGQSALERLHAFEPDLAVIDIGLPEMDGYQLARKVRQMKQFDSVMLVALTGYARQSDREAAIAAGFDLHLAKPINLVDFFAQISAKFSQH